MFSRRWLRVKFLIIALSGGMLFQLASNCAVFWGQQFQTALNYTWFLTCDTDTLLSGDGILIDCENQDSSGTTSSGGTSSDGLTDLLGS